MVRALTTRFCKALPKSMRYDVQNGIVTIPKSTKEARILSNSQVFDFKLSTEDIEKIDALNKNETHGDPDHVDF